MSDILKDSDRRGEVIEWFEVMLNRFDAASLAARDRLIEFLATPPAAWSPAAFAFPAACFDFTAAFLDFLAAISDFLAIADLGPVRAPAAPAAAAPFTLRFTLILFKVCFLLFERLLEASVKRDVSTLPMHLRSPWFEAGETDEDGVDVTANT
jgi:hypothetical protein